MLEARFLSRWAGIRSIVLALPLSLITLAPVAAQGEAATPPAGERDVILATTTSTQDSGLLDVLVPLFAKETGYTLKPISVGSGAALELGERGEADVLLVHSPAAEEAFMEAGYGAARELVMVNDFIIVGPAADPAGIADAASAVEVMQRIAESEARFVSRGDDSGTHSLELKLWEDAGIEPGGEWYQESGTGMGDTLNIANERDAYTVTDRGTYLALWDRLSLEILSAGDPALLNIYHVITVNPERYDTINVAGADAFMAFILDPATQDLIGEFGVDRFGDPLFTACAENSCNAEPQATPT
ncbi:MAG: substrate-binding domain-containing protein [Chloroflexota bacterium]|nr:substrate-binding domain-containing protein [Chloroflexota bacterium]